MSMSQITQKAALRVLLLITSTMYMNVKSASLTHQRSLRSFTVQEMERECRYISIGYGIVIYIGTANQHDNRYKYVIKDTIELFGVKT